MKLFVIALASVWLLVIFGNVHSVVARDDSNPFEVSVTIESISGDNTYNINARFFDPSKFYIYGDNTSEAEITKRVLPFDMWMGTLNFGMSSANDRLKFHGFLGKNISESAEEVEYSQGNDWVLRETNRSFPGNYPATWEISGYDANTYGLNGQWIFLKRILWSFGFGIGYQHYDYEYETRYVINDQSFMNNTDISCDTLFLTIAAYREIGLHSSGGLVINFPGMSLVNIDDDLTRKHFGDLDLDSTMYGIGYQIDLFIDYHFTREVFLRGGLRAAGFDGEDDGRKIGRYTFSRDMDNNQIGGRLTLGMDF